MRGFPGKDEIAVSSIRVLVNSGHGPNLQVLRVIWLSCRRSIRYINYEIFNRKEDSLTVSKVTLRKSTFSSINKILENYSKSIENSNNVT